MLTEKTATYGFCHIDMRNKSKIMEELLLHEDKTLLIILNEDLTKDSKDNLLDESKENLVWYGNDLRWKWNTLEERPFW